MKYQHVSHQSDLLVMEEESRRLKLRSMLLRDENSLLKDEIVQLNNHIKSLNDHTDDLRAQLDSVQQKCGRQEKMMQSQAREIANLKVWRPVDGILPKSRMLMKLVGGNRGIHQCLDGRHQAPVREARPFARAWSP